MKETILASFYDEQQVILYMISIRKPLKEILAAIVVLVETHSNRNLMASVLLADEKKQQLRVGAAPSLPEEYSRAIDGIYIAEGHGLCGTAAYRKQLVHTENITEDPDWVLYRELAAAYGLISCWSMPIINHEEELLGTFAVYHKTEGLPSPEDLTIVDIAIVTTIIAINLYKKN